MTDLNGLGSRVCALILCSCLCVACSAQVDGEDGRVAVTQQELTSFFGSIARCLDMTYAPDQVSGFSGQVEAWGEPIVQQSEDGQSAECHAFMTDWFYDYEGEVDPQMDAYFGVTNIFVGQPFYAETYCNATASARSVIGQNLSGGYYRSYLLGDTTKAAEWDGHACALRQPFLFMASRDSWRWATYNQQFRAYFRYRVVSQGQLLFWALPGMSHYLTTQREERWNNEAPSGDEIPDANPPFIAPY